MQEQANCYQYSVTVRAIYERQSAWMSKITNDGLIVSDT